MQSHQMPALPIYSWAPKSSGYPVMFLVAQHELEYLIKNETISVEILRVPPSHVTKQAIAKALFQINESSVAFWFID